MRTFENCVYATDKQPMISIMKSSYKLVQSGKLILNLNIEYCRMDHTKLPL